MRKLLVSIVLCAPVVANADLLFIKYEGAVSGIEAQTGAFTHRYSIGDPVSGQLTINLALADGGAQANTADYLPGAVSFVNGRPLAVEGKTNDAVFFYNSFTSSADPNTTFDRVEVYDNAYDDGGGRREYDSLSIMVERLSSSGQLMTDARLAPEFDVTPDEGTTLTGKIQRGLDRFFSAAGEFTQTINVTFSHVSMGVCKPST